MRARAVLPTKASELLLLLHKTQSILTDSSSPFLCKVPLQSRARSWRKDIASSNLTHVTLRTKLLLEVASDTDLTKCADLTQQWVKDSAHRAQWVQKTHLWALQESQAALELAKRPLIFFSIRRRGYIFQEKTSGYIFA